MPTYFFSNYGGPGEGYDSVPENIELSQKRCKQYYTGAVRDVSFQVKGIDVTVHTYGIHRAVTLTLPDGASPEPARSIAKHATLQLVI